MKRHVRKKVETSGDDWMTEESVLFFIYTPVITTSLVSKPSTTNRPILLAIVILFHCYPFGAVFALILLTPFLADSVGSYSSKITIRASRYLPKA